MKYLVKNVLNLLGIGCLRSVQYLSLLLFAFFLACESEQVDTVSSQADVNANNSPLSIRGLQERDYKASLTFEKALNDTETWTADLWSYYSDSLKIYTLMNTPKSVAPEKGFPVLIFGHGFHPTPKAYGVSYQTGQDWRPGDYYRGIPESYAEQGFLVLTPDYRGHNVSDGFEYTQSSFLASTYYAIDVLHLIAALKDLEKVNLAEVFYLGHSMGGDVGLKMLLATDEIKAASLWAAVSASTWEQALYYGKYYEPNEKPTDRESMKDYLAKMDSVLQNLGFEHPIDEGDPIHFIHEISSPIILHHGRGETAVPYQWSESLAAQLFRYGKTFELHAYETENHLFKAENRITAIARDIAFFEKALKKAN